MQEWLKLDFKFLLIRNTQKNDIKEIYVKNLKLFIIKMQKNKTNAIVINLYW